MKNTLIVLLGAPLAVILGLYAFMWLGVYDMGADSPHRKTTVSMLTMMRERSIERHDAGRVPGHRRQGAARRRHGADGSRRDDIHLINDAIKTPNPTGRATRAAQERGLRG